MENTEEKNNQSLTVTSALNLAKGALEQINITILGEVSEVNKKAGYKAVYFTIKDDNASLPCMMWISRYSKQSVNLEVGALVNVTGRFSLYAKKGRMSFDVTSIKYAGEGELRMRVAQLAKKLEAQGLMNPENKRALPAYPETIGVVTSPRGAAVHDVLRTLRRRYPLARVLLAGVPVEGVSAATGLSHALEEISHAGAEVILLVRGGGSFEDLMPFNDETLARTIAKCTVPVVTGIGHEPDNSIADMVADHRASTPTAAAEAVSPNAQVFVQNVYNSARHMHDSFARRLEQTSYALQNMASRPCLSDPNALISNAALETDDMIRRLSSKLSCALDPYSENVHANAQKLMQTLPHEVNAKAQNVKLLEQKMASLLPHATSEYASSLSRATAALNALSPLATLSRGYAITRNSDGQIIKSTNQLNCGDNVNITFGDGCANAQVTSISG